MGRSTAMTRLGIVAGILILGVGLSGCSVVTSFVKAQHKVIAAVGKPKVGECWTGTIEEAQKYANWGDSPPVDCTQPHQLDTFAVPQLESAHKGRLYDSQGKIDHGVSDDALNTCFDQLDSLFPIGDNAERLIDLEVFLPETPSWNSGARWVRCDVAVFAYGSSVAHPTFAEVPGLDALEAAYQSTPKEFDFCVNDRGGIGAGGPKGANAVYADCRGTPQWVLKDYDLVARDDAAPIPYSAAVKSVYNSQCKKKYSDKTHSTYPYYPSKLDYDDGEAFVECWVGAK